MKRAAVLLIFIFAGISINAQLQIVSIMANDLAYDKSNERLYAIVAGTDYNYGNCLVELNPFSGQVENSVYIGSDPKRIKLTYDNNYAYVSFSSIGYIKRVDLNTFSVDQSINLGPINSSATGYALGFEIIPNTIDRIVVSRTKTNNNNYFVDLVMYIDGVLQPNRISGSGISIIQIVAKSDGETLFGYNSASTAFDCYRIAVLNDGVSLIDSYSNLIEDFCSIKIKNDTVYCGNGKVIDPFSTVPTILGACPVGSMGIESYTRLALLGFVKSDIHNSYIYPYADYDKLLLNFYDINTYAYSGSIQIFLPEELNYTNYMMPSMELIDQDHIACILTDQFNYKLIALVNMTNSTDIKDNEQDSIKCYPNPVMDMLTIELPNNQNIAKIEVFSTIGETLYKKDNITDNVVNINLSNAKSGVLLVKLTSKDGQIEIKKVVKN